MKCPKCQGTMMPVDHERIEVDRCSACGGLWFDLLEHEELKRVGGSEDIDVGESSQRQKHDSMSHVLCPRDQARMLPMVDRTQPHIWFESCPVCHGAYFDAGEFKDFKDLTLFERLVPRRRPRPI